VGRARRRKLAASLVQALLEASERGITLDRIFTHASSPAEAAAAPAKPGGGATADVLSSENDAGMRP
jgi:hypothetical protein